MDEQQWNDTSSLCFGMLLDGRAQTTGIRQRGKEATLLILFNGHGEAMPFRLPDCTGACGWALLLDTNFPDGVSGSFKIGQEYAVMERSVVLFAQTAEAR